MEFMEAQTYLGPSFDAKKLTIAQLSSLLSAHGVPLPPSLQRKAVYVDLFQAQVQAKASKILKSLKPVQPSSKGIEFVGASEEQPEEEPLNDENYNDENAPVVVVTARKAPSTPLVDSNSNTPLTARKKLRVSEEGQGRVLVPLTDANQNHTLPERVITPIKTLVPATEERPASPSKLPLLASMQSPRRASSRFTKLMAERPQMSPAPIDKEETPKDDEKEVAPTLDRFMISANMPGIRSKVSASVAETEDVKPVFLAYFLS